MFYLNLKKIMRLRGIENDYRMLLKLGFASSTARMLLDGSAYQIKFEQLEKICLALNCTPNDLLEWQPPAESPVAETHSLQNLRRKPEKDLPKLLAEIPSNKLDQVIDILQQFSKD